ncbi:MAG: hypothetical protein N2663_00975 [Chlorobi bacterium]|nr:hypothetical protein [Chlorobiota bacterium]
MIDSAPDNHEHPEASNLLRQLPRVTAPLGFEETVLLRRMMKEQLPHASAPEGFEEKVLSRLRECESLSRHLRPRRLRLASPRTWIAIGVGAAIVGGIAYYFASTRSSSSREHHTIPAPHVLPLVVPTDSAIEEELAPPTQPSRRSESESERPTVDQPSTPPGKRVTPGVPEHDQE